MAAYEGHGAIRLFMCFHFGSQFAPKSIFSYRKYVLVPDVPNPNLTKLTTLTHWFHRLQPHRHSFYQFSADFFSSANKSIDFRIIIYLWTASWSFRFGNSVRDPELAILRWRHLRLPVEAEKKNQFSPHTEHDSKQIISNYKLHNLLARTRNACHQINYYLRSRTFLLYSGSLRLFLSK